MRTGEFERDIGYLSRCVSCVGDVDVFPDEAAFLVRVGDIRTRIGKENMTPLHWGWVAAGIPVWWCVVVTHFLCMVSIAHWLGDPTRVPEWLKPIDTFLVYQISNAMMIVFEIIWLLAIAFIGAAMVSLPWLVARAVDRIPGGSDSARIGDNGFARAGLVAAAKLMFLPITISLLTLAIMPISLGGRPGDSSMLEAGTTLTWTGFVTGVSQQSYMVFMALLLLLAFVMVISAMIRWLPDDDGFWQLPVAAVIALVAAITVGGLLFKLIYPVVEHARGVAVTWVLFGFYALFSIITRLCFGGLRQTGKPAKTDAVKAPEKKCKTT